MPVRVINSIPVSKTADRKTNDIQPFGVEAISIKTKKTVDKRDCR